MKNNKVGIGETLGYSFGAGFGKNLFFAIPMMYMMIFFTDTLELSAVAVGTLFLAARVWDAVNDPMMGMIVDRSKFKMGKCKPYMIFGSIALLVSFVLVFTSPSSLTVTGKLIWAYGTYIFFGMMYTLVDIPSNAAVSLMTEDGQQRSKLVAIRSLLGNFGMLIGLGAFLPLVGILGRGDNGKGYTLAALALGSIAMVLIMVSGIVTKERVKVKQTNKKYSIKEMLNVLVMNKPLVIISIIFMASQIGTTIKAATTAYYLTYNIGRPELIPVFSIVPLLFTLVGTMFVPLLTKMMGKKKTLSFGFLIIAVTSSILFFAGSENITVLIALFAINGLGSGIGLTLPWVMLPDTVEYSEWKTGHRSEGLINATFSFGSKFGAAVGGALLGFILEFSKYVPNSIQPSSALSGIKFCVAGIPVIIAILGIIIVRFYDLDDNTYQEIVQELKEKRTA